MSAVVWNPVRDRRDQLFFQVTVFLWENNFNIDLWHYLTVQDHVQLQCVSYTSHICCVDIVIFLLPDSDSDFSALADSDE